MGGGGLAPSEQSILADSFPASKRGQAFALYGVAVVVAPTLGPTLGGFITDSYSWRWIFLINVPVCLLSLFLSGTILSDPPAVQTERKEAVKNGVKVDFLGFGLVAVGLGCLQIVLDKGTEDDWFSSDFILVFAIISALSLAALVIWELSHDQPIVDLSLMRSSNFSAAMFVMFVTGFILISTTQVLPQFLQEMMGYTATKAGLALTAGGCATLLMMPVAGALLNKGAQPKYLIIYGLIIESAACYYLRGFNNEINFGHAALGRMFQGMGLPFLFVPITTVSYAGLPPGKSNSASALINTMRNLGGSFGISMTVGILARRSQFHHARIAESLTPYAPALHTHPRSLVALSQAVQRQAQLFSYVDIFAILALFAALAVPCALLLKTIKREEAHAAH